MRPLGLVLFGILGAACGGGGGGNTDGIPDECNPLGGQGCRMPWPSSTYLAADATSATGFRLAIPREAMPISGDGTVIEPTWMNRWDGFSPTGPMLAAFPTGVSGAGLPPFSDPDKSLAADSPIILLDMATGERAPFFAEIDQNEPDAPSRDLIIRPLARLHEKARYVVAITNKVKADGGGELQVPAAFAALRDGTGFSHPRFADMQKRYADIFAALATAGVDKSSLVLAWDFQTASDEFLRSDMTTMRAAALPAMGANGASLSFTSMELGNTALTLKRYIGTYKSPGFLSDKEQDDSIIVRDGTGAPALQGLRDAQFAAIIPACAATHALPLPAIVFGHGIFGSAKSYLDDGFVQTLANEKCFVIIAGDFIGLTERQLQLAPLAVNDMNRAPQITEKLGQSIVDFMALETLTRTKMAAAPEFQIAGAPVIDATKVFYVGGSLGGIMGNTFMAYDPNITRGVLAVPGGAWSMLFERSNAWSLLQGAAQGSYADPAYYQLNLALLGMSMEPFDPITTAAHVIKDPLLGNPVKTILMWYTMGDCLVTNITTEMVARTMGIDLLGPAVKTPWHMTPKTTPLVNAINVFNDHPTPLPPDTNVPPAHDNGTHSGINRKPAALRLVENFLLESMIVPGCMNGSGQPAPCDCATGACD